MSSTGVPRLQVQLISTINSVLFLGGPILVAIAAFWTYTALGHTITAAMAFPALAYFDLLRFPIIMLPMQVMNFVYARVAVKRLQQFMNAEDAPDVPLSVAPSCFLVLADAALSFAGRVEAVTGGLGEWG
jgi:ABC-type multidrug transport system fused ATPase/permease subunit